MIKLFVHSVVNMILHF